MVYFSDMSQQTISCRLITISYLNLIAFLIFFFHLQRLIGKRKVKGGNNSCGSSDSRCTVTQSLPVFMKICVSLKKRFKLCLLEKKISKSFHVMAYQESFVKFCFQPLKSAETLIKHQRGRPGKQRRRSRNKCLLFLTHPVLRSCHDSIRATSSLGAQYNTISPCEAALEAPSEAPEDVAFCARLGLDSRDFRPVHAVDAEEAELDVDLGGLPG